MIKTIRSFDALGLLTSIPSETSIRSKYSFHNFSKVKIFDRNIPNVIKNVFSSM